MTGNTSDLSIHDKHRTADKDSQQLVNLHDCKGWTPLHYACYDSNKELVKQLLDAGANKDARYSI